MGFTHKALIVLTSSRDHGQLEGRARTRAIAGDVSAGSTVMKAPDVPCAPSIRTTRLLSMVSERGAKALLHAVLVGAHARPTAVAVASCNGYNVRPERFNCAVDAR